MKDKIYAFIPARAGSKGIKKKNHLILNKKPLYQIAIDTALSSKCFDKIIVSTDDEKILSTKQDTKVILLKRPKYISSSTAKTEDALLHAIKKLKITDGYYLILQCTSPFRTSNSIIQATKILKDFPKHCLIGAREVSDDHPARMYIQNKKSSSFSSLLSNHESTRRQDLPKVIHRNGLFYGGSIMNFIKTKSVMYNPKKFLISNYYESVNIDNKKDYDYCIFLNDLNNEKK